MKRTPTTRTAFYDMPTVWEPEVERIKAGFIARARAWYSVADLAAGSLGFTFHEANPVFCTDIDVARERARALVKLLSSKATRHRTPSPRPTPPLY